MLDSSSIPVLDVRNLSVAFTGERGEKILVVDDASFSITSGQTLGIVGESGCGKSVTSLAIMGLLDAASARISGEVSFDGVQLSEQSDKTLRDLRGNRMAIIFQEPMTSLNPAHTIGSQISEAILRHRDVTNAEAKRVAIEALKRVSFPSPETRFDDYPHKLSGGMRQRVMIAMALACNPKLLIADEPTTALDVTIQAQILDLLRKLREETGAAVMLITHDLGVVAEVCDEVLVMYAGQIVEKASIRDLFATPQHPYTVGLLGAIPRLEGRKTRLATIAGSVPIMANLPDGCRFAERCPFVETKCRKIMPALVTVSGTHMSRCWKAPLERLVL